jgi:hypothetical protein
LSRAGAHRPPIRAPPRCDDAAIDASGAIVAVGATSASRWMPGTAVDSGANSSTARPAKTVRIIRASRAAPADGHRGAIVEDDADARGQQLRGVLG